MKLRYNIFTLLALGVFSTSKAQEATIFDALRLSTDNITGTARYRAMGGAFGALGGDLSSINANPAGTSFFNNNQATVTLSNYNYRNNANYFGTSNVTTENSLDINQLGAVLVFKDNKSKSSWNKFAVALNYENQFNFDDFVNIKGTNPYNSMDAYFLNHAQGIDIGELQTLPGESISELYAYHGENGFFSAQQAMLGYQGYIIDEDTSTPGLNDYWSNVPTGGNFYHNNTIETKGYNSKMAINFSGAYANKLFLGANLNFNFVDITKYTRLYESNSNPYYSTGYSVNNSAFENSVYTYGAGFSVQLGAIYKPIEALRFGLSYQSPTWYRLNDELTQSLQTNVYDATDSSSFTSSINPNTTNIYPAYKVQTPNRITLSGALIIAKKGLISVDYTLKNYNNTMFSPENDNYFNSLNNVMDKALVCSAYELRVGGEYKIKRWSVRGGYRFDQSPFNNDLYLGDYFAYSGGLGYTFGRSRIDLAYTNEHRNRTENMLSSGLNDLARIRNYNNNVTVSYTINF